MKTMRLISALAVLAIIAPSLSAYTGECPLGAAAATCCAGVWGDLSCEMRMAVDPSAEGAFGRGGSRAGASAPGGIASCPMAVFEEWRDASVDASPLPAGTRIGAAGFETGKPPLFVVRGDGPAVLGLTLSPRRLPLHLRC